MKKLVFTKKIIKFIDNLKTNSMNQTAVEWLTEKLRNEFGFAFSNNIFEQAKEMEKEQQDKFAIEFAEWLTYNRENNYTKSIKELLEIFKNK